MGINPFPVKDFGPFVPQFPQQVSETGRANQKINFNVRSEKKKKKTRLKLVVLSRKYMFILNEF